MRGGLTARMLAAGGLVGLIVVAIFAALFLSLQAVRDSSKLAQRSADVIAQANLLERLMVDIQTGWRGYLITGDERFLEPWRAGRAAFPEAASALERLVGDDPGQTVRAQAIERAARTYIDDWAIPVVETARRDLDEAQELVTTGEGKRRFDALRAQFDAFVAAERDRSSARRAESDSAAVRAEVFGAGGLAGSLLLILLFTGYLTRAVVAPVRRLSEAAGRLARGELTARAPEGGKAEIAELTQAFNAMAGSLAASQEELDRFFTLSLEMLCIADLNGYFRRINPAFEKTLGYTAEELLSKPFLDFVHPDDREATLAEVEKLARGADVIAFENRYRCSDGSCKWILWTATAVPEVGLIYAAARDISGQKRTAEEIAALNSELECQNAELEHQNIELAQQTLELESQQAELECALAELGEEKERIDAFYTFAERLGSETHVEALSKTVLGELADFAEAAVGTLYAVNDEAGEADGQFALAASRGIATGSSPGRLGDGEGLPGRALAEGRLVQASYGEAGLRLVSFGKEVAVRHELSVPLLHGGRKLGVVTLGRLADRAFAEDELSAIKHLAGRAALALAAVLSLGKAERQASIQSAVLNSTLDGVRLVDLEGKTLLANDAIERTTTEVFGLSADSTLAERSLIAERLNDPVAYRATMEKIAADPECTTVDEFELSDSGRTFKRYTAPVRDAADTLIGRIIVLREVTREREAERLKSDLVATVSHELRTPLSGILGFTELLLKNGSDPAKRARFLETIYAEAKRLSALIDDFLDLQRIEAGRFTLSLESLDLAQVLREQVAFFAEQSEAHPLTLDVPLGLPLVRAERERLSQVVANLLSNALKYSPAGGAVTVAAEAREGSVRVSVADRGLGIPAAQQEKIFTKFFRVDSSDTREIGGTGLGLALCREMVEAHGGQVGFESVEGEGSTFWFELPAGEQTNANRPARVLVIEDDPKTASLFSDCLGEEGYALEVSATGEDGLECARRHRPDVVCLDIDLPGELDGLQVLARLKAAPTTADVPVIVYTAANGRQRACALGASDVLLKPISPERLRETVKRLLPAQGGSLLVVDDEESVRRLVAETLSGNGLELREAADGEEALAAVSARRPDAIILDLAMPKLDGFAVLERLHSDPKTRLLPIVVLTARRLSSEERELLKRRAVAVLQKSAYSAEELRRLIDQALGR